MDTQSTKKSDGIISTSRKNPIAILQRFLHDYSSMVPVVILILTTIGFRYFAGDRFFSAFNLSLIIQQVTIIGILRCAQTLIVLTAGINLSVAAIMVLASVVAGKFAMDLHVPKLLAVSAGILVGTLCGALNGALVTRLRLPPFIVSLAWIIHEITKPFRIPFSCSKSCSVGNTVCIPLIHRIRYRKRDW